jgi:hypothetical protein
MPRLGQKYGARHDKRFDLHSQQPRASKLTGEQFRLCQTDSAYASALRCRVSDPDRWTAFLAGARHYEGRQCGKCGSNRRRTRDGSCYDCLLTANRNDWALISKGIAPPAQHSRAGYLDSLERQQRERSGEVTEFRAGSWTARQYPTGRLAVTCSAAVVRGPGTNGEALRPLPASPYLGAALFGTQPPTLPFECSDLNAAPPDLLHGLAARNPAFMDLLRWASWG